MEGNIKRLVGGLIAVALVSLLITNSACAPKPTPPPTPPPTPVEITFEECVEASSFKDYYEKAGIEEAGFPFEPEWMNAFLEPVPIPIRTNLSNAEIYNIPLERVGGDVYTNPIIKSGNLYCVFTDSNAEKLFAPIQKEEAIDYLIFRLVTLGESGYQVERYTILTKEDYEKVTEKGDYFCEKTVPESEKRITTIQETQDGFLINWVFYTFFGERAGYYEHKVKIGYDAKIQYLEAADKPFFDCGPGAIF